MADPKPAPAEEATQLYILLTEDKLHPAELAEASGAATQAGKDEMMRRVAAQYAPEPPGKVVGRIGRFGTDANQGDMTFAYIANLRSSDPEARAAALNALDKLAHPSLEDLAILSLRDDSDAVLTAACYILAPKAASNERLRRYLESLHAAHLGRREYHMSQSVLEGYGVGKK